jgi:hypothetical protein
MGLKCSLFGHAFDERDVVRERDSTGSEVVTIVKHVERCTKCSATRVVSTNKEVVSAAGATADGGVDSGSSLRTPGTNAGDAGSNTIETPDQLGATGPAGPEAAAEPAGAAEEPSAAPGDDGGLGTVLDPNEPTDAGRSDGFDGAGFETNGEPADEDAAILDGGSDATAAATGAATGGADTADTTESTDPAPQPATDADTGTDADETPPETEDAEILTDEQPGDRAPGQWPGDEAGEAWTPDPLEGDDEPDTPAGDAETTAVTETADADGETPDTTAEPAPDVEPEPAATASFTVPEGHYRCPECGHTIPAESSFRRGDACPECVHGYLEAGS